VPANWRARPSHHRLHRVATDWRVSCAPAVGVQVRGGTRPLRTRPAPAETAGSGVALGGGTYGCLPIWLASAMRWSTRRRCASEVGPQVNNTFFRVLVDGRLTVTRPTGIRVLGVRTRHGVWAIKSPAAAMIVVEAITSRNNESAKVAGAYVAWRDRSNDRANPDRVDMPRADPGSWLSHQTRRTNHRSAVPPGAPLERLTKSARTGAWPPTTSPTPSTSSAARRSPSIW
jgi:hypothetical protein